MADQPFQALRSIETKELGKRSNSPSNERTAMAEGRRSIANAEAQEHQRVASDTPLDRERVTEITEQLKMRERGDSSQTKHPSFVEGSSHDNDQTAMQNISERADTSLPQQTSGDATSPLHQSILDLPSKPSLDSIYRTPPEHSPDSIYATPPESPSEASSIKDNPSSKPPDSLNQPSSISDTTQNRDIYTAKQEEVDKRSNAALHLYDLRKQEIINTGKEQILANLGIYDNITRNTLLEDMLPDIKKLDRTNTLTREFLRDLTTKQLLDRKTQNELQEKSTWGTKIVEYYQDNISPDLKKKIRRNRKKKSIRTMGRKTA
jgi:hypothetical protein